MSDSNGGIGIGTIIFWIFMANMFGFCDGDDEKSTEVVVEENIPSVTETVKKTIDDVKPELEKAAMEAKKAFDNAKKTVVTETKKENVEESTDDTYSYSKDNTEDRFNRIEDIY